MFSKKGPSAVKEESALDSAQANSVRSGSSTRSSGTRQGTVTRILIKYDVGFNNTLYIRGNFANLNWIKGIPMQNLSADVWVWECDKIFPPGEFKVLINDNVYESGPNHNIECGAAINYTPQFWS